MRTLLTFTGFQDPYAKGPLAGNDQVGPILSLLSARPFERAVLRSTPNATQRPARHHEAKARSKPRQDT